MKHIIEEIDKTEELIFKEKQRNKNIAISSVLWSILTVELGCEYLSNPSAIIGLFTLLTGGLGAKTYLGFLDSKDVIHNYEKQLEKLRK